MSHDGAIHLLDLQESGAWWYHSNASRRKRSLDFFFALQKWFPKWECVRAIYKDNNEHQERGERETKKTFCDRCISYSVLPFWHYYFHTLYYIYFHIISFFIWNLWNLLETERARATCAHPLPSPPPPARVWVLKCICIFFWMQLCTVRLRAPCCNTNDQPIKTHKMIFFAVGKYFLSC